MCGRHSQLRVQCVPVHRFRCESGWNFFLNSHLNQTQTCTGPFWIADCGHPGPVWTGLIVSRSHSHIMPVGCRENHMQFAYMWTWPKGPFTGGGLCLLSRGSVCWSPLSRRMAGPCPLHLCRADTDTARSPLWWSDVNKTTCPFTPNCHPIRWTEGERIPISLVLADRIGCRQV